MICTVSSAMFDWNEEELANIIWGEAGETDDHIVPFPEGNEERPPGLYGNHIKKEWNPEATNAKLAEQNKPVTKNGYTGNMQESTSQHDTAEGISGAGYKMDPWPDLSLSRAAKTYQESMGTKESKNLTEIARFDSSSGDALSQLDDSSCIFRNQHEDGEQSDFIDYGWDNIGSFDDLDKIFSDDDQIFGHVSLGNADRPWSSSKEVSCTGEKSFPLCMDSKSLGLGTSGSTSGPYKIKTEHVQDNDQSFTQGFGKMIFLSSHGQKNVQASAHQVEFAGGKSKSVAKEKTKLERHGKTLALNSHLVAENITCSNELTDKVCNKEKLLETRKKSGGGQGGKHLQDSCSNWSPFGNQFQQLAMPLTCSGSEISEQTQLHTCNLFVAPSVHGNIRNQNSTMNSLPQIHSGEERKPVLSGFEVSPSTTSTLSGFPGTSIKPLTMTPQEKIEKLRRRQQMQALLAIQKQQQQFSHQVSSSDHSVAQKSLQHDQTQLMQGGNIEVEENVSTQHSIDLSIDPKSPIEHDDSNTICMVVDDCYSVEEIILRRLEDIIAKLDIRIRLCIRDSLFRLAQSAMQRHYAGDMSSTIKNSEDELEVIPQEETSSQYRFTRIPDVEAETNHIDRAVAYLLFHRPELPGKHSETPESPASTKHPRGKTSTGLLNSQIGLLPGNDKSKQNPLYPRPKNPHFLAAGDQSKNSPCVGTSENASNEASDAGGMEIEALQ